MEVLGGFLLFCGAMALVISFFVAEKYPLTRIALAFTILAVAALHWGQRLLS